MKKLLFLLLCSGLLIACEDVLVEEPTNDGIPIVANEISKEEAEAYFLNDLDGLNFEYNTEESVWIPIWSSAYTYSTDSADLLEVSLFHIGKGLPDHISRNLLFFRDKGSKGLRSLVKEVIPDTSVVQNGSEVALAEFTGHIIYHDWFDGPLFGYRYASGEIVSSIVDITGGLPSTHSANGREQKSNGCRVSKSYYDCTESWTYTDIYGWRYTGTECDRLVIELECFGSSNVPLSHNDNVRTSGGVGVRFVSDNVVEYPSGIKFSGSIRPCIAKITKAISKAIEVRDRAANAAVRIMQRGANPFNMYQYLQEVYGSNSPLVIELREAKLPENVNARTYPYIRNVGNNRVISVALSRDYLDQATDLSIARTIMHESIHALMVFGAALRLEDSDSFRAVNRVLFNPDGTSSGGGAHHDQMSLAYVDEIADLLETFAKDEKISTPNTPRRRYVEYLAFGGLEGTMGWNALSRYNKSTARRIISQEANRSNTRGSRNSSC